MLRYILQSDLLKDAITSQDLSSAALSFTTSIGKAFQLEQVLIHSDTALTETATITLDSKDGANYDTPLGQLDFDGGTDLVFVGGDNLVRGICLPGSEIKVSTAGLASSGIVYVTLIYSLIK